jgi:hypothetical protein
VIDAQDLNDTSYRFTPPGPVPREKCRGWTWHVRARVNGQWTDWSPTRTFDLAEPAGRVAEVLQSKQDPREPPVRPEDLAEPEKQEKQEKPIEQQPLPSEAARKQASQAIREIYKKRYAAAKTAAEHLALADNMLHKAEESADPAAQFVLLDRARALCANAGDTGKALEIVEQIGQRFQIDVLPMKVETMTDGMQPGVPSPAQNRDIGKTVLELMEQLGRAEQYEAAMQLGNLYRDHARRPVSPAMMRRVLAQINAMRDGRQESAKAAMARDLLKTDPNDPAANAALARYLCVFKGDWDAGLPFLAKGNVVALRDLAGLEKAVPGTAAERMKLADAWYAQAEKESAGTVRLAFYRRARHWYETCTAGGSDPEAAKAQKQIERIDRMGE